jgi:hypothetical protein
VELAALDRRCWAAEKKVSANKANKGKSTQRK